jgi:hypothetical protein
LKQIGFGRHRLAIGTHSKQTQLKVDGEVLFSRVNDRSWNIAMPAALSLRGSVHPSGSREVIFMARGHVRLAADEAYDADKHQFGLKVWLESE